MGWYSNSVPKLGIDDLRKMLCNAICRFLNFTGLLYLWEKKESSVTYMADVMICVFFIDILYTKLNDYANG